MFKPFSDIVKYVVDQSKVSLNEVSRRSEVNSALLSLWVSGKRYPHSWITDLDRFANYAEQFGISKKTIQMSIYMQCCDEIYHKMGFEIHDKKKELNRISNLLAQMTLDGATEDELIFVIDYAKDFIDDNIIKIKSYQSGINNLEKKYCFGNAEEAKIK